MSKDRNKVRADTCGPLAQAVLSVRERGMISERWIETALIAALEGHNWLGERPVGLPTVGKTVARLVYGKKDKDALAKELARVTKQERVRDTVLRFFRSSGLAETGVPVDHGDIGREQLMAAMLGRFVYGVAQAYHEELDLQGAYTLLQSAGASHVNRSILLVESLQSTSVIWAVHLYRSAGAQTELKARMGIFLPGPPHAALLSMARWSEPAPVLDRWLNEEDARAVYKAVRLQKKQPNQTHALALLNFKPDNRAELIDEQGMKAIGIVLPEENPDPVTVGAIGLVPRSELSHLESSRAPQPNASHAQAYAEAQDALARFAAIAGASRAHETITPPAGTGEPELAAGPADIPGAQAQAIASDLSADNPPPQNQFGDGEDAPPAQIS